MIVIIFMIAGAAVKQSQKPERQKETQETRYSKEPEETIWHPSTWVPITVFTLALVVVGGIQGCLFLWQLGYLKSADETARRSADAALKAAEAAINSSKTYQIVERAWMNHDGFVVTDIGGHDELGNPLSEFGINWRNTGHTPALKALAYIEWRLIRHSRPIGPISFPKAGSTGTTTYTIGPNKVVNGPRFYLPLNDVEAVRARRRRLIIWAQMEYANIFDADHLLVEQVIGEAHFAGNLVREDGSISGARWQFLAIVGE